MINETPNTSPKNQEPIVFDFDENDFDFKPITQGLGFHKNKKEEKRAKITPRKSPSVIHNFTDSSSMHSNAVANSELAAFYSTEKNISVSVPELPKREVKKEAKAKKLLKAPLFNQVSAFVIDLILVTMATGLTLALLMFVSGLEYEILVKSLGQIELAKYILSFFVIYYVSYFTILDVAGTVGKSMMGIRLVHVEGKKLRLKHTFIRSLVTLLSFVALGLPSILDFQGRLSETKLVK